MNNENVQRLIDHLEATPDSAFNMEFFWAKDCGCIGGHAWSLFDRKVPQKSMGQLGPSLGISAVQALYLQVPGYENANWGAQPGEGGHISRGHAIAVLKNLLKTGRVDWGVRA